MNSAFTSDSAADYFDSMSDYLEEQQESIRETSQSDWSMVDRSNGIVEIDIMEQQASDWEFVQDFDDLSP